MKDKSSVFCILLIAAFAAAVYSSSLGGALVYGDNGLMQQAVPSKGISCFLQVTDYQRFSDGSIKGAFYRPVLIASLLADRFFWGDCVFGYHLTNLILHILNCIILFLLLKFILRSNTVSFIAALIFSVHPIQVEAVSWISGRNDILFSIFALLSLLFYAYKKYPAAGIMFLVSLFAKESAIVFLVMFFIYDAIFLKEDLRDWKHRIWIGIALLIYFIIRSIVLKGSDATPIFGKTLFQDLANVPVFYFEYTKLLLFPFKYSFMPAFPRVDLMAAYAKAAYLAVSMFVPAAIYFTFRKVSAVKFGLAWFIVMMLPSVGIIPTPFPLMEHRLYFASIGFFIIIAYPVSFMLGSKEPGLKRSGIILLSLIVIFSSAVTYNRNKIFRSPVLVWAETVKNNPGSVIARENLAKESFLAGDIDEAARQLEARIRLGGAIWQTHYNLGSIYAGKGDRDKAVAELEKALLLRPDDPQAIHSLIDKIKSDKIGPSRK